MAVVDGEKSISVGVVGQMPRPAQPIRRQARLFGREVWLADHADRIGPIAEAIAMDVKDQNTVIAAVGDEGSAPLLIDDDAHR